MTIAKDVALAYSEHSMKGVPKDRQCNISTQTLELWVSGFKFRLSLN